MGGYVSKIIYGIYFLLLHLFIIFLFVSSFTIHWDIPFEHSFHNKLFESLSVCLCV